MARASWKLCSMSGLQTPSASADDKSFSSSLISPTSRCLLSAWPAAFESTGPIGPVGPEFTLHGDVMVLVLATLAANSHRRKNEEKKNPINYDNLSFCV